MPKTGMHSPKRAFGFYCVTIFSVFIHWTLQDSINISRNDDGYIHVLSHNYLSKAAKFVKKQAVSDSVDHESSGNKARNKVPNL